MRRSLFAIVLSAAALFACGNATSTQASGGTSGETGGAGPGAADGGARAASAGTADLGGNAGAAVTDTRPPQPEWVPPFDLGTPGWRDSQTPNCVRQQGSRDALSIWADSRGVFSLAAVGCNALAGVPCGAEGVSLFFNSGSGWESLYEVPSGQGSSGSIQLGGFPGGALLLAGGILGHLGIYDFDAGELRNVWEFQSGGPVFGAGSQRAYALDGDNALMSKGGAFESTATLPSAARAIWADDEIIAVAGDNQTLMTRPVSGGEFEAVPGVPAGDYGTLWGFGASDLWLGNLPGQLVHYDGSSFKVVDLGTSPVDPSVRALWGADGDLYFISTYEFGRIRKGSTEAEILISGGNAATPRIHFHGLWGLSATEVFLAVSDEEYYQYRCGGMFTLMFDGAQFHEF